jgi:hypothetical protein
MSATIKLYTDIEKTTTVLVKCTSCGQNTLRIKLGVEYYCTNKSCANYTLLEPLETSPVTRLIADNDIVFMYYISKLEEEVIESRNRMQEWPKTLAELFALQYQIISTCVVGEYVQISLMLEREGKGKVLSLIIPNVTLTQFKGKQ